MSQFVNFGNILTAHCNKIIIKCSKLIFEIHNYTDVVIFCFFEDLAKNAGNHPTYRLWAPTSWAREGGTGPHLILLADVGRVVWTAGRDWPQAGCAGWRGRLTIAACTPAQQVSNLS
jgi:hypothetical protein